MGIATGYQIFLNLSKPIHAMPDGGTLSARARVENNQYYNRIGLWLGFLQTKSIVYLTPLHLKKGKGTDLVFLSAMELQRT